MVEMGISQESIHQLASEANPSPDFLPSDEPTPTSTDLPQTPQDQIVDNLEAEKTSEAKGNRLKRRFGSILTNWKSMEKTRPNSNIVRNSLEEKSKNETKHLWQQNTGCLHYKLWLERKGQTFLTSTTNQGK